MIINGWLNLYKDKGYSSYDAIRSIKKLLPAKPKIGHAGTLDPQACGVLPIAIGEGTKSIPFFNNNIKEYIFEACWGKQTTTDDAEGEVIKESTQCPSAQEVTNALVKFIGKQMQVPPIYSAKKISGNRAYKLARQNVEVILGANQVDIISLSHLETNNNKSKIKMVCGSGTYVRALVRDIGNLLGCYGYADSILRTRVGSMGIDSTVCLEKLAEMIKMGIMGDALQSIIMVLDNIPAILLNVDQEKKLRLGQILYEQKLVIKEFAKDNYCQCISNDGGKLIAIAIISPDGGIHPKKVFNI